MESRSGSPISAAIWAFVEKFVGQAVSFLIGIVLARLLSPSDYGLVGMTSIFFAISYVFIDSGFGSALIRKIDRTESDLSTVFYFNIAASLFFYLLLYFTAPLIAKYFHEALLIKLIRISGLSLIFASFCTVQNVILTANLKIKTQTIISLLAAVPSGGIAIFMAYKGLGVYALVFQGVLATAIRSFSLCLVSRWKPQGGFNKESFRYLFSFGSKLVGANLIGTFFDNVYSFLIGKYIGKTDLGYFSKGDGLKVQVFSVFSGMVQRIALPILSRHQDDKSHLSQDFRLVMRMLVCVIGLIAAIMTYGARDLVIFLWTDKWSAAASITSMLVIGYLWVPLSQLSLHLLQVVNRTDLILKLEFPKKAAYIIFILIGFQFGVKGLCLSLIASNIFGTLVNMYAARKVVDYNYITQILDILKYVGIAYAIGYVLFVLLCHFESHLLNFLVLSITLTISYFGVLLVLKDDVVIGYSSKIPFIRSVVNKLN